jgi:glutamyl-tRNA synthetase
MKEMAQNSRYFFAADIEVDAKAAKKFLTLAEVPTLEQLRTRLQIMTDWSAPAIHASLNELAAALGVGLGKVAQPLRVAVTGSSISPPIDLTLALVGRERTLARLDAAIGRCRTV